MKNRLLLVFSLLGVLAIGGSFILRQQPLQLFQKTNPGMNTPPDNKDKWKQVDSLAAQGLPQSALELVNAIYTRALKEGDMPEFLKAGIYQLRLRSDFEEDYIPAYIAETEKKLGATPVPARQILHSILADLYWQYYQQNRYRILDQTAVAANTSEEISTWDAKMFVAKVAAHYHASLQETPLLQTVNLKMYDPILEKAEGSKKFRPTLYDFLAHRAIDFFCNEEASVSKPVNPFMMEDIVLLSAPEQFTAFAITTTDSQSFHFNALRLLQAAEKFHLSDSDVVPLVDATLRRLEFVHNTINHPAKDSLYLATLTSLEARYAGNPVSAGIIEKIAAYWYSGNQVPAPVKSLDKPGPAAKPDYITAHAWCLKAIAQFPESDGARNCRVMLQSIENSSLAFTIDKEVAPAKAFPVQLNFRNSKTVWLRLLKPDYDKDASLRQELYGERGIARYLEMKPVKEWSIVLPETNDYQSHAAEMILPAMEAGYYALVVSGDEAFAVAKAPLAIREFRVTGLSYISKRNEDGSGLFYLLDRSTGQPLQGVKAQAFTREYDYRTRNYIRKDKENYTTAADGSFIVQSPPGRDYASLSFDFGLKNDRLVAENYFARYRNQEKQTGEKTSTFFFTDRSIYRPGQVVYYKGIVVGTEGDKNRIVPDHQSEVTLYDVNGQKVASAPVVSNEFGSFSGSFVLPGSGLGGQFRIENGSGNTSFAVEEYKRPKFAVTFLPVTGSYRLNQKVTVSGKAESYSGVPVSEANVSYRVVRSAFFPYLRYGRRMWPGMMPESEIAHGSLTTGPDGTYEIAFTALPDPSDYGDSDPVYNYTVTTDITDINGETRSSLTSVMVSARALIIGIDIPVALNREDGKSFRLTATNLNGKTTPAQVTVEVFRLVEEERLTRARRWERPDMTLYTREEFVGQLPADIFMDEDEQGATKGKSVYKNAFNTATDSLIKIAGLEKWAPGRYLVSLRATDAFGQPVITEKEIVVFAPASKQIPVKQAFWATMLTNDAKAGEKIRLLAGSAANNARMLYEVQCNGKTVHQEWMVLSQAQKLLEYPVAADFTGDVSISLTLVSDNRSYAFTTSLDIADTRHQLSIAFETFRSPLLPGGTEKWKLKLTGPDGKPLAAEVLAGMYDASLDAFAPHNWFFQVYGPWHETYRWENSHAFENAVSFQVPDSRADWAQGVDRQYDQLNWFGYNMYGGRYHGRDMLKGGVLMNADLMAAPEATMRKDGIEADATAEVQEEGAEIPGNAKVVAPEPQIRRNMNETAFFYPQLVTNQQGEVLVEFTVPEALTTWNFMGLAHTTDLRYGQFAKAVVTRKELMVTPNLPRFFREGDRMVIQCKVSNLTANPVQGEARLQLLDALTLEPLDELMKNQAAAKAFSVDENGNTVLDWGIVIPEGISAVMVRITARAGNHSDGEEVMLPVLTNRMLVTESMPLPVNGNETREFTSDRLLQQAGGSTSLRNHRLTLEYTSNPAWYAIQALPYLAEQTHENSDQVFNRLYANNLAAYIANSSPKIRNVFETWKQLSPDALLSNLDKNQELKGLVLEETPWLMEAKSESAQKQRIALLFDLNRMAAEKTAAFTRLQQMQSANGGWPWFEGMPESSYITRLIVTGFGRLHYLKVIDLNDDKVAKAMVQRAVDYLSSRLAEDYALILKDHPGDLDKNHISQDHIQFMYALSYLQGVVKPAEEASKALAYFGGQARKYWTSQGLYGQGMVALWAGRNGDQKTAGAILKSLRERSLTNPELGMYWRDNTGGYYWHQAPVETQALLIELFEEIGNDPKAADQMKTWLLKQKQTMSWATSSATADAVYALLLRGGEWLQTDPGVRITIGGQTIDPATQKDIQTEAGTGYFKMTWSGQEIKPQMGRITVSKSTAGPAWGAYYLQYFENTDKVTNFNSPLKISRQLFIKTNTDAGPVLELITESNPLKVGQHLVVRVELITDRDLEYVHMKDMHAAGLEPVNTLSGYQWKGGAGYYENTRDAATHFFFSYLPKGTRVFEYPLVVAQQGEFSNGVTTVQCMYAPEFGAHSEGIRITVR